MDRTSVVGPSVDLSKVEAINQKRTLAFINHWVLHTVAFLNQFSTICEDRLLSLDAKLQRADLSLAILEAKLSSVPSLDGVVAPVVGDAAVTTTDSETTNAVINAGNTADTNTPVATTETAAAPVPQPQDTDAVDGGTEAPAPVATPISKDPRFIQYFRMLSVGVPEQAVRLKMSSSGLDPSLIENPDAPAPPMEDIAEDSDSSSVSSWSD